jgi:hypothetical protein
MPAKPWTQTVGARMLTIRSEACALNEVIIAVEDSGPGIDPKDVDRIFDPFFTTKSQGLADQLLGTTKRDPKYNFAVMDDIAVYPADKISTPVGKMSVEWLKTLEPSILNMQVPTYKHAM